MYGIKINTGRNQINIFGLESDAEFTIFNVPGRGT